MAQRWGLDPLHALPWERCSAWCILDSAALHSERGDVPAVQCGRLHSSSCGGGGILPSKLGDTNGNNFLKFQRDKITWCLCLFGLRPLETSPLSIQGVGWTGAFWGRWWYKALGLADGSYLCSGFTIWILAAVLWLLLENLTLSFCYKSSTLSVTQQPAKSGLGSTESQGVFQATV